MSDMDVTSLTMYLGGFYKVRGCLATLRNITLVPHLKQMQVSHNNDHVGKSLRNYHSREAVK